MNSKICYSGLVVIGCFLLGEGDERTKRDISRDPRIFNEWKVKAEAWLKLKVQTTSSSSSSHYLTEPQTGQAGH